MLLYNYSPADLHTSINVRVHDGKGLGSLFARIFSKVAVKTAAKTALNAAKVAGKKAIKVAARQGVKAGKQDLKTAVREGSHLAKDIGTDLTKEVVKAGQNFALQGITAAEQKLIKKVGSEKNIHSIANVLRDKTSAGAQAVTDTVTNKLNTGINNLVARHSPPEAVIKKSQRKRKSTTKKEKKAKTTDKTTAATLSELIDQI